MLSALVVMVFVLALALGVTAVVIVGMEGRFRDRNPRVAHVLAATAQHLNGDKQTMPARVHRLVATK